MDLYDNLPLSSSKRISFDFLINKGVAFSIIFVVVDFDFIVEVNKSYGNFS